MKKSIVSVLALAAVGIAALPASGAPAEIATTAVFWHAQSGNVMGTPVGDGAEAQLVRTENGISYSLQTTGLRAGHAYTVWVVVINNPSARKCRRTQRRCRRVCGFGSQLDRPTKSARS